MAMPSVQRLCVPSRDIRSRPSEGGFTLVEILVVITIIALVMSLVGPRVLNYLSDAKAKTARIQIQGFSTALDLYYLDNGNYPASAEGLSVLLQKPAGAPNWNGPYLKTKVVPNDPWGRPYVYRSPGENEPYEILSLGADGRADSHEVTGGIAARQQ